MENQPTPRQQMAEGKDFYQKKQYDWAADSFKAAQLRFQADGDAPGAAEAANNLAVCLLQLDRAQQALEAVQDTPAVFQASGNTLLEGQAYGNLGMALEAVNRPEDALHAYQQSADCLLKVGERDSRSYVLSRISALQICTGKQVQALQSMESALENRSDLKPREKFLKSLLEKAGRLLRGG